MTVSGLAVGQEVGVLVEDPMAKPVPMRVGQAASFKLDGAAATAGLLDVGVVRIDLPPQEPVEAFAFGGRVYDSSGKPLAPGYVMHVSTERGDRKTSEEIEGGKFALIFIDLQGEFPRIKEGDRFRFSVRDKSGREFPVEPSGYGLTRTDIANSSISTLEFKVKL